jgi:hypothetical protein
MMKFSALLHTQPQNVDLTGNRALNAPLGLLPQSLHHPHEPTQTGLEPSLGGFQ